MDMEDTLESEAMVALRIASRSLKTKDIVEKLKQEPTESYDIGEPISLRGKDKLVREQCMWILESGLEKTIPFEKHLECIVDFIKKNQEKIEGLSKVCDIDLFCEYTSYESQGGFTILGSQLDTIGKLPIDIIFDTYCLGS